MSDDVIVIVGIGGMGAEVARREGSGVKLVLADCSDELLDSTATQLRHFGYDVQPVKVDVRSPEDVVSLVEQSGRRGQVQALVHTAGVSATQATVETVLGVDLLGVALVLEEFGPVLAPGGSVVVIASMAAHMHPALDAETEALLCHTPARELLSLPCADPATFESPGAAYAFAKYANLLRVRASSVAFSQKGVRVNSVSPGVISTPMALTELDSPNGEMMRGMIAGSNARRLGTPADIAEAVGFLLGRSGSFVSGTDLLVDGGVMAAMAHPHLEGK